MKIALYIVEHCLSLFINITLLLFILIELAAPQEKSPNFHLFLVSRGCRGRNSINWNFSGVGISKIISEFLGDVVEISVYKDPSCLHV